MRHRRQPVTVRAALWCFRAARAGVVLGAMLGVLAAVVALCIAGDPSTP
ncbi:hypothetical protein [Streptomyces coffeae]|uniref:Uncharacterized protein n=1 Tax=Streptomyces coffeae TaxID=621382 RepID=A0ABS1NJR6_9ACTN|nr:hypothetical protein [Streptomyces coffeae]MBL1100162.1 hypothetical protein [Streptomyces coffeae]